MQHDSDQEFQLKGEDVPWPSCDYDGEVQTLRVGDKTVLLIGTAHVSRESVQLVDEVIARERPDGVCLELDRNRYLALTRRGQWQELDLRTIIRRKQLSTLLVSLLLASYQKRLGDDLGVSPGAELLAAAERCESLAIPFFFCDRDVRVTLRRAWKLTSLWKKNLLLASLLTSFFDDSKLSEEQLRELKQQDMLAKLLEELGGEHPALKQVLIDERDLYLAEKIRQTPGKRLVAVIGAGHVPGVLRHLGEDNSGRIAEIERIPEVSRGYRVAGWTIPMFIVGSIVYLGLNKGADIAGESMLYWVLANGIPSSLGALLALGHPMTVLSAFVASPFTSLSPLIGAGYVCAFVQLLAMPPKVAEIETSRQDLFSLRGWWRNRLLRIFLVFLLTSLGSVLGTWLGGYHIAATLLT
jgi:pheromone shutdown-related protein TraB